ncbi:YebC/PmpR family DNA-binding transcriptional regulator [Candidatus Kaiserbacteria bacterium]|nr:YebC/PmpR family DNA-binding transcriptional regulator [Candidatus Kaiserbacteria bacterium]
MSGHSKWSQIKRQKSVIDAAKSRTFSRLARLIALESKSAGGGSASDGKAVYSAGLLSAIARAKAANMPKENIERAIAKGVSKDSSSLEQVMYEAYGPGGVAFLIEALTDNKNRTTQEIKHLLSLQGIELASPGAASWAFTKAGGSYVPNGPLIEVDGADEERVGAVLGALDEHTDVQRVFTNARGYEKESEDI